MPIWTGPARNMRCAALLLVLSTGIQAEAQEVSLDSDMYSVLPGADMPYLLKARDLDVKDALRLFAKNLRIGLMVEEAIAGPITEDLPDGLNNTDYINELAAIFDFVWYFDGSVLRVSPVGDMEMEVIALRNNSGDAVIEILQQLGIYQSRFMHRSDPRSRTLMVSGPKSYTALVKKAVQAVEEADRTNIVLMRGEEGGVPDAVGVLADVKSASPAVAAAPETGN
jgi:type II secretory pathway component GspD/PulD (secretin)